MPPAADSDGRDISEVYRVLRSGGRLVIYVTSRDTMQKWPFAGPDTHRTFDAHDLADFLVSAGFRRSHIIITNAELALGVKGLIAVAEKFGHLFGIEFKEQSGSAADGSAYSCGQRDTGDAVKAALAPYGGRMARYYHRAPANWRKN